MAIYLTSSAAPGRLRGAVGDGGTGHPVSLTRGAALVAAVPVGCRSLLIVRLRVRRVQDPVTGRITEFSTKWLAPPGTTRACATRSGPRSRSPLMATAIAVLLGLGRGLRRCTASGSSAARPCRCCWCCRSRCPGIVTGLALNSFRLQYGGITFAARRSSPATPPSAWWWSTTTCWPACDGRPARWRRRRWTWAPTAGRRSATSRCQRRHRAGGRRPAGLRALVRRGDRHHFTAGSQDTLPLWIFQQLKLPKPGPAGERGRRVVIVLTFIPVLLARAPDAQRPGRHRRTLSGAGTGRASPSPALSIAQLTVSVPDMPASLWPGTEQ